MNALKDWNSDKQPLTVQQNQICLSVHNMMLMISGIEHGSKMSQVQKERQESILL